VRRLLAPDAPAFREIRLEGLRDHPDAFGSSVREEQAQPLTWFQQALEQGFVLGDELPDGQLGGVAGLRFNITDKTRHKAWLWGMYVRPQARGTGLAARLISGIVEEARDKVEEVVLTVGSHNAPAIARYRSMGFEECGVEQRALKVGDTYIDDLMMSFRF
jgi:ribosomal protein S18 acetylase RimI-like enzyme